SIVNPGNVVKIEIYWDYANDSSIKMVDNAPSPGKIYSHLYPEFRLPFSKLTTIHYVAYSGQTCEQYIDKVVTILATPTIQFDTISGVCKNAPTFQVSQASIVNGLAGSGSFSGVAVSSSGVFSPSQAAVGTNTIRYTYISINGCSAHKYQTIEVYP